MTERSLKLKIPPRTKLLRRPLSTQRLTLAPVASHDAFSFFDAVDESRPALAPWLPWVHLNNCADDSVRYAQACERDWDAGTAARFFVKPTHSHRVLGVVSLENCSTNHRGCQLGYWLHVQEWGKGLMTEAATRVLGFAFEDMRVHRVSCAAGTDNVRSLRVIERLGFRFEGIARDAEWIQNRWISHSVYSLLDSEWQARFLQDTTG